MLSQSPVISEGLRLDAAHDPLGVGNQIVELLVATDVQLAEPLEELGQIAYGRVAELCRGQDYADFFGEVAVFWRYARL